MVEGAVVLDLVSCSCSTEACALDLIGVDVCLHRYLSREEALKAEIKKWKVSSINSNLRGRLKI